MCSTFSFSQNILFYEIFWTPITYFWTMVDLGLLKLWKVKLLIRDGGLLCSLCEWIKIYFIKPKENMTTPVTFI